MVSSDNKVNIEWRGFAGEGGGGGWLYKAGPPPPPRVMAPALASPALGSPTLCPDAWRAPLQYLPSAG